MAKRAATTTQAKAKPAKEKPAKAKPAKTPKPTLAERLPALAAPADGPADQPPSAASLWREARNAAARARLEKSLPAVFPAPGAAPRPVAAPGAANAAARRRELLAPPHPAGRPAGAGARRRLRPAGGLDLAPRHLEPGGTAPRQKAPRQGRGEDLSETALAEKGLAFSFRMPPAPFREAPHARGKGHCCICGQPVYRFGWHRDLWGTGTPNRNAAWHAACVTAWKFWIAPADHVKELKRRQGHRCAQSGKRLLKTAEVDHRVPLYRIWREERARPWPELLGYWGLPNLQVVNRAIHADKCAAEAGERASVRRRASEPEAGDPAAGAD